MESNDSLAVKATEMKKKLCQWEQGFHKAHGRRPLKKDIDAFPDIALQYKQYRDLKKKESKSNNSSKATNTNTTTQSFRQKRQLTLDQLPETTTTPKCKRIASEKKKESPHEANASHLRVGSAQVDDTEENEEVEATPLAKLKKPSNRKFSLSDIPSGDKANTSKMAKLAARLRGSIGTQELERHDFENFDTAVFNLALNQNLSKNESPVRQKQFLDEASDAQIRRNLRALQETASAVRTVPAIAEKAKLGLLPTSKTVIGALKKKIMHNRPLLSDTFMSPQARPGQAIQIRHMMVPPSARKVQALLFSPKPKMLSDDFKTKEPNDEGQEAVGKVKEGEDQGEVNTENAALNENDVDDLASDSDKKPDHEIATKTYKKRPINGKRQTSKRKLRPIRIGEDLQANGSLRGFVARPLKLNRRGKKFKAINHALVDKSGPLISQYSHGKNLVINSEDNPFDVNESEMPDEDVDSISVEEDAEERVAEFSSMDCTDIDSALKSVFQFESFRPYQRECVENILAQRSTILVQPTGSGKSLCYLLPAYLLCHRKRALALVIMPTISLIEDQIKQLPKDLRGAGWSSNNSMEENKKSLSLIRSGELDILYISPEKLITSSFAEFFDDPEIPPIAFACVDEVHCLSEWSHNFRPAYLQVQNVLTNRLKVSCILGLTATATHETILSICNLLQLDIGKHVLQASAIRDNFRLSVSKETNRKKALVKLLSSEFLNMKSIIVYCMRQADADGVAQYLRTVGEWNAESYHAGKTPKERANIQQSFISGKLAIICATIAFGLGINKSDVEGIIHYSLPKSIENYVQEIGRAGRNGRVARCHLFLDQDDFYRLRSLSNTDSVDAIYIKHYLEKILFPKTVKSKGKSKKQLGYTLDVAVLEKELDLRKNVLATILSNLSLEFPDYIRILPNSYLKCRLVFYKHKLDDVASRDEMVTHIIKSKKAKRSDNYLEFSTYEMADSLQLAPSTMLAHLRGLQFKKLLNLQLEDEAFCYELLVDTASLDFMHIWQTATERVKRIEEMNLYKVEAIYSLMESCASDENIQLDIDLATEKIKDGLAKYFSKDSSGHFKQLIQQSNAVSTQQKIKKLSVSNDVYRFVQQYRSAYSLTGRIVARIFHAIPSPAFPSSEWYRNDFWGKYMDFDFIELKDIATKTIMGHDSDDEDDAI